MQIWAAIALAASLFLPFVLIARQIARRARPESASGRIMLAPDYRSPATVVMPGCELRGAMRNSVAIGLGV
jgi:hypothetical protein